MSYGVRKSYEIISNRKTDLVSIDCSGSFFVWFVGGVLALISSVASNTVKSIIETRSLNGTVLNGRIIRATDLLIEHLLWTCRKYCCNRTVCFGPRVLACGAWWNKYQWVKHYRTCRDSILFGGRALFSPRSSVIDSIIYVAHRFINALTERRVLPFVTDSTFTSCSLFSPSLFLSLKISVLFYFAIIVAKLLINFESATCLLRVFLPINDRLNGNQISILWFYSFCCSYRNLFWSNMV